MKNRVIVYYLVLILFLIFSFDVNALSNDYYIDNYDVNVIVNEDNSLNITEKISVDFKRYKHGIFRKIPIKNEVVRLDGTSSKNKTIISNINVNDYFSISKDGDYKVIKIGDENSTLIGSKDYIINYTYDLGKDKGKGYDELYFNLIGDEWDTTIYGVSFSITMPKNFDASKLGFSSGKYGSTDSSNITYSIDNNVITGKYNEVLNSGEALTVRLELPEGYFKVPILKINETTALLFAIPFLNIIICFLLWVIFGKDKNVIDTVEFYPPPGFNSLEVGYLYKGRVDSKDITSLLIYLANKGYLKIREVKNSKSKTFKITRLKGYDGKNKIERIYHKALFRNGNVISDENFEIKRTDVDEIVKDINNKKNKELLFDKKSLYMRIPIIILMIVTFISTISILNFEYGNLDDLIATFVVFILYGTVLAMGMTIKTDETTRGVKLLLLLFVLPQAIFFFTSLPIYYALLDNYYYLFAFVFCIISLFVMRNILRIMPKRTSYGNEIYAKIKGFKRFLETAEKSRLELLVMDNPTYFYDILPYAYVLGVSNKWIKKFESISLQSPEWFNENSDFSVSSFGSFMNKTYSSTSIVTTPSTFFDNFGGSGGGSSGGGSGGGSSGGGSGGGGGGSW